MLLSTVTPGDRYAAAHEHFSAGFTLGKILLIIALLCLLGMFIYFAVKKGDDDK